MNKLLNANFSRLLKNRGFWGAAVFMALYAAGICMACVLREGEVVFDGLFLYGYGLGGMVAVPGIVMAAFCSMFVGTEFSDGTIRNKLVVGRRREEIYLADFITCAAVGIMLNLIYSVCVCAIGIPLFGGFRLSAGNLLWIILAGMLMMVSYAAIFTMITILLSNKTVAAVVCLISVVAVMCVTAYIILRLQEPEIATGYQLVDGSLSMDSGPNPLYIGGTARTVCQMIVDLFPSGQGLQLSGKSAPYFWPLALYSAGIILVTNIVGVLVFRKKDLK